MKHPLEYIEGIQQKPEPVRKMIAAVLVAAIMIVILGLWSLTTSLAPTQEPQPAAIPTESTQPSPFTLLWNYVKDLLPNK